MRVMVFVKATEDSKMDGPPTPEQLEAFAAMDRFIKELVKAGVFVAVTVHLIARGKFVREVKTVGP